MSIIFDRNNTSYNIQIFNSLKKINEEYNKNNDSYAAFLKYYQYFVRRFMSDPEFGIDNKKLPHLSFSRGLLIYHSMGMGKTYLAISVALSVIDNYKPLILLPKSLQLNFKNSIGKIIELLNKDKSEEELELIKKKTIDKFEFLSSNANNVGAKMSTLPTGLDNRMIIVDEAHNLFRAIISSGGKETNNAKRMYDAIMKAKNVKILFLTGTPCSKDPYEIVPCFNMLAGYELLPIQYNVWTELFINKNTRQMLNLNKLANRLFGLVSFAELKDPDVFPEQLPTKLEKVEMSPDQYHKYLLARQREQTEAADMEANSRSKSKPLVMPALSLPSSSESFGSYYVKSRMLGNYCNLKLNDLSQESPKIIQLTKNIETSTGPVIVYSQFVKDGGLGTIGNHLESLGYTNVNKSMQTGSKTYAYITGEVSEDEQKKLVSIFNDSTNMRGERLRVLLVSKTGAEGLDLKYIRQVHILEPYWDQSRINQVIARAVRLNSHKELPKEERNVQPYVYLAVANQEMWNNIPAKNRESQTTDELFYSRAVEKEKLNVSVRKMLQSISIECQILQLDYCRICKPTNEILFTGNIRNDIKNDDPCIQVEEYEEELEELTYDGKKYYYKKSDSSPIGYIFYKYDEQLDSYVTIDFSDPIINELIDIIDPFVF